MRRRVRLMDVLSNPPVDVESGISLRLDDSPSEAVAVGKVPECFASGRDQVAPWPPIFLRWGTLLERTLSMTVYIIPAIWCGFRENARSRATPGMTPCRHRSTGRASCYNDRSAGQTSLRSVLIAVPSSFVSLLSQERGEVPKRAPPAFSVHLKMAAMVDGTKDNRHDQYRGSDMARRMLWPE